MTRHLSYDDPYKICRKQEISLETEFKYNIADDIEWPLEEDFPIAVEARTIITELLARNPRDRLGTGGTHQVKVCYFLFHQNAVYTFANVNS